LAYQRRIPHGDGATERGYMRENHNKRLCDFVAGRTRELIANLSGVSGLSATNAIRALRAILDELAKIHTILVDAETEREMRSKRRQARKHGTSTV
jgi:hypothetical protein